jgi:putative ABC transport system permease protein
LEVRELAGHPLRTAVTVAMIAVCSALVVAVAGLVESVESTAGRLADQAAGTADVEIASAYGGGTVPTDVVDAVARVPGLATVAPTVQAPVTVGGERALLVAGDARALAFIPDDVSRWFTASGVPGRPILSDGLGEALDVGRGDRVQVQGASAGREAVVGGVLPAGAATGNLIVADLETGMRLRGGPAGYDRLLVGLSDGPDGEIGRARDRRDVMADLRRAVGGRAALVDPDQRADDATDALEPLVQPLLLLAGLTVTVAGVLVFNVVSVSVAERRRHLAIQCALGARRRRLWARLVGEAALLGAIGGVLGAALGRRVTAALLDQVPPALTNAALPTRIEIDVPAPILVAGVAVGIVAAGVAAAVAGLPVVRLSPVEAMGPRDVVGESSAPVRPLPTALGIGCIAAGTVAIAIAPAAAQVLAALVILDGVVILVWALRGPLARAVAGVARRARAPGVLAALAIERSPARNATTVLGAFLPVAAVVTLGGIQVNTLETARRDVESLSEADLYISGDPLSEVGSERVLPPDLAAEIAAVDGVESVRPGRFGFVRVAGGESLIEGIEPGSSTPTVDLASPEAGRRIHDSDAAIVSRAFALRLGVDRGDTFELPTVAGNRRVTVADVIDIVSWPSGLVVVSYDHLSAWSGREAATFLEVRLDRSSGGAAARPDRAAAAVAAAVERRADRTGLDLFVTGKDEAADEAVLSVRQAQALFTALQAVLMAAGAFAIVSTLIIATIGRTRELGLIRAVGARRRLLQRAVLVEAFVVTLTGAATGIGIGTVFQFVGVRLASRANGIPADFALTPRPSVTALVAAVAIASAAAAATLRRVLRLDILDAIAYE